MTDIEFIWDREKNIANVQKHGVDFDDAVRAYYDPYRLDFFDDKHSSIDETRWIYLGAVDGLVLFVVETEPNENVIRIISARPAVKKEQETYHVNREKNN